MKNRILAIALAVVSACASVHASSSLLEDISLAGQQSTVRWTNLSNTNASLTPSLGSGSIAVASPGYKATAGFYSFSGDYSATTGASASFDIDTVVLQLVAMQNPDHTLAEYLTYGGGPVLTYTFDGGSGTLGATSATVLAGPVYDDSGFIPGNYYNLAWEWDLSALPQSVSSVSIQSFIPVHTSITGAQLDLSDTFTVSAIPEPAAFAALAGFGALILAGLRRRRA